MPGRRPNHKSAKTDSPKRLDPVARGVGEHLKKLRLHKGLTQTQLGKALGVTQERICQYELGQRALPHALVYRASLHFSICPGELYGISCEFPEG